MKPLIAEIDVGTRPPIILTNKNKTENNEERVLRNARRLTNSIRSTLWINGMLGAYPSYMRQRHNTMYTN